MQCDGCHDQAAMFTNASHFNAGEVSQVRARNYHNHGKTLNPVTVNDGGQYTKLEVNSKEYHRHAHVSSDPLDRLHDHTCVAAMHSADERVDSPKCHEETRKAVQQKIFSWINSNGDGGKEEKPRQVLWLTGPAGAGKTAIMGSVAYALQELAASFYFASYMSTPDVKSKRRFVTTLAYQLQQHPSLEAQISKPMLSAIRKDPAVFQTSLEGQMDKLILGPLKHRRGQHVSLASTSPLVMVIDGLDECGEDIYDNANRSREKDQLDVLSVLFHAMRDPSFPCRIIIASRPENWIRRFFSETAAGQFTEIFLDNKYDPDSDISLFLRSKFAEIGRRHGYDSSAWPAERDIQKLVEDASGQFIYAATVIRFIDSAWPLPKHQLEVVLKVRPLLGSTPFGPLDALYTAILKLSPSPRDTVLWLKAVQRIGINQSRLKVSGWTIDRLFESAEGQARAILRLPSLVYMTDTLGSRNGVASYSDFSYYVRGGQNATLLRPDDWNSCYSFYHKSFLDFLDDGARCGVAFPDVGDVAVEEWVWGRIAKVLECDGPEVPMHPELLLIFKKCVISLLSEELVRSEGRMVLPQDVLANSDPNQWLLLEFPFGAAPRFSFFRSTFIVVHRECRFYRPCLPGCKRWRTAILRLQRDRWAPMWSSFILLLDRFCIRRITTHNKTKATAVRWGFDFQ